MFELIEAFFESMILASKVRTKKINEGSRQDSDGFLEFTLQVMDLCFSLTLSMQCCFRSKWVIFSHLVVSNSNLALHRRRAFSLGSSLQGLVTEASEQTQDRDATTKVA